MKETRNETTEQQEGENSTPVPDDKTTTETVAAESTTTEQGSDTVSTAKPPENAAAATPVPPAAEGKRCGATWPGKLALLLSVVALGGGAYLAWEGWQMKQQNSQLQSQISQQVETLIANSRAQAAETVAGVSQQLGQLQARAEADKANIDELQDRLTRSIQQVTADAEVSRKDWLLAEVEYLLRLANQRVLMEQTATGALTLLKSADESLRETDDVTLYDVRKALAEDIAALEAVPKLDTEGVFLKLAALNRQVNKLRVTPITDKRLLPALLEELTPESVEQSWGEGLKASWNKAMDKFETLIVIQHHDEAVKPLMSPEQTFFLQQNLHLMLEQAQMALLQRKQPAYDASLSKAHDWIGTHFDAKNATTQAMLRTLNELQSINVAPELPDISGSLASLKTYLRQMQELRAEG